MTSSRPVLSNAATGGRVVIVGASLAGLRAAENAGANVIRALIMKSGHKI